MSPLHENRGGGNERRRRNLHVVCEKGGKGLVEIKSGVEKGKNFVKPSARGRKKKETQKRYNHLPERKRKKKYNNQKLRRKEWRAGGPFYLQKKDFLLQEGVRWNKDSHKMKEKSENRPLFKKKRAIFADQRGPTRLTPIERA